MRPSSLVRVLLVDDYPLVHDSLVSWISPEDDVTIVGAVDSAAEVETIATSLLADVVLVDAGLADPGWPAVTETVLRAQPVAAVVLLGNGNTPIDLLAAWEAQVIAVIDHHTCREDLLRYVRRASSGRRLFTAEQLAIVQEMQLLRDAAEPLTPREIEVRNLMLAGMTNRAIGDLLCISGRTVDKYVTGVLAKYGVSSRMELIAQIAPFQHGNSMPAVGLARSMPAVGLARR